MKTLLVAAESVYLREALAEDLAQRYRVLTCADGKCALETICAQQPDVVVIDLTLGKLDGLAVLREAAAAGIQSEVMVLAGYVSESARNLLESLKVRHIFRMPGSYDYMLSCLLELASDPCTGTDYAGLLIQLGFQMNTESTRTLLTALSCYMENPNQKIVCQLYPQVAKLCGSNQRQVEKAIRSAIESAWKKHNRLWLRYFPADINGRAVRPSNGAFLSCMAIQIKGSDGGNKTAEAV